MTQRIIITEGPDRTGKTEIGHALSRVLGIPYFKASSEHMTYLSHDNNFLMQLEHADPRVLDLVKQTKMSVIFDRAYPSEWVYSRVLGRKTNDNELQLLDDGYSLLDAKLVICTRSSYEGITDDLDKNLDSAKLQELDNMYRKFASWTNLDTFFLNVDDEYIDREVDDVLKFIELLPVKS